MAIMQNGKEMVDLQINGRMIESAKINDRYVYPDSFEWDEDDAVFEVISKLQYNGKYRCMLSLKFYDYTDLIVTFSDRTVTNFSGVLGGDHTTTISATSGYTDTPKNMLVKISGSSKYIGTVFISNTYQNYWGTNGFDTNIKRIINFGNFGYEDISFNGCRELERIDGVFNDHHSSIEGFSCDWHPNGVNGITPFGWQNYQSVGFGGLFGNCLKLEYINPDLFYSCVSAKGFASAFYNCPKLKTIPSGLFRNNTLVESFEFAFCKCTSLESIPDDMFIECTELIYVDYCFSECTSIRAIPYNFLGELKKITRYNCLFKNSFHPNTAFPSLTISLNPNSNFNAMYYGSNISNIELLNINMGNGCFSRYLRGGPEGKNDYDRGIFETSKLIHIGGININGLSDSDYLNLNRMFKGSSSLSYVGNITVENCESVSFDTMFNLCVSLHTIGNITGVTANGDLSRLCWGCSSLNNIGVIKFKKVTSTAVMFGRGCTLTSVVFEGVVMLSNQIANSSSLNSVICDFASIPRGWPNISLSVNVVVYELGESPYLNPHNYYSKVSTNPEYVGGAYSGHHQQGWNEQEIRHLISIGWQPYGATLYGYAGYYIDENGNILTPW